MEPCGEFGVESIRYPKSMAILHWLTAVVMIAAYLISESSPQVRTDPPRVHMVLGLSVLAFTLPRLCLRLFSGVPRPLKSMPTRLARLSRVGHAALYALLFLVPLTGWITASRLGLKIELCGVDLAFFGRPVVGSPGSIADMHQIGGNFLFFLALLHVGIALWHFFRLRDQTLQRMWPF